MEKPSLSEVLYERHALSNLEEIGRTDVSTIYRGTNTWGTKTVSIELFDATLTASEARDVDELASLLPSTDVDAVFSARDCGIAGNDQLFIVRDESAGTALRSLVESRSTWGQPFGLDEVKNLLGPVANAVDTINDKGHPTFLTRSLDMDTLLVQQGQAAAPIMLDLVGPVPGQGARTATDNVASFAAIVGQMLGEDVDPQRLSAATGASNYLASLGGVAADDPENQWDQSFVPAPAVDPAQHAPTEQWESVQGQQFQEQRPQQYFPDTDPGIGQETLYESPDMVGYAPVQPAKKNKVWPWLLALVVLLAAGGAGGYWWYTQYYNPGKPWSGESKNIQSAFPALIAEKDGGKGWQDLVCREGDPEDAQKGKIRCGNAELGVTVTKFESEEARTKSLPPTESVEVLGKDACEVASYTLESEGDPAFILAPKNDNKEYTVMINGADAEQERLALPVCE